MAYMATDPSPVLARGIDEHMGLEYPNIHLLSDQLFHMGKAMGRYKQFQQWVRPGRPTPRAPMEAVKSGDWGPSHQFITRVVNWGQEFAYALEDLDDDPYGIMTRMVPLHGGAAAHEFSVNEEIVCMEMLANYITNSTGLNTFDGTGLVSAYHPRVPGSTDYFSNMLSVSGDPDIVSTDQLRLLLKLQQTANKVEYEMIGPRYLLCHDSQERVNTLLWANTYDPWSADRNENFLKKYNVRVVTSPYFQTAGNTSTNQGCLLIGDRHFLYKDQRKAPTASSETNQHVQAVIVVIVHRWMTYWKDFRGVAGTPGP